MSKKLYIVTDECIGCESCVELCPDFFEFDEDKEKASVIKEEGGDEECIADAIASCPTECIHYE